MDPKLRQQLTHYLDHLMDHAWLVGFVKEYGLSRILYASATVLSEGKPDEITGVLLFVRDLGQNINRWADDIIDDVRESLPEVVLPAIRPLLHSPSHFTRRDAIHTLGKLSYRKEAKSLRDAFPQFLERDPLGLADLMFELRWLQDHRGVRARARQMMRHNNYLIRWSTVGFAGNQIFSGRRDEVSEWKPVFETLANDRVSAVRDEAQFILAHLRFAQATRREKNLPDAEWERRMEVLQKDRPPLTFDDLRSRFYHDWGSLKRDDYSVEELFAFATKLGVRP